MLRHKQPALPMPPDDRFGPGPTVPSWQQAGASRHLPDLVTGQRRHRPWTQAPTTAGPGCSPRPGRRWANLAGTAAGRPVPGAPGWAVAELPPGGPQVVAEVAGIAAAPASLEERAAALLESLHPVVPFQAGRIALLDPERRGPVSLVSKGYADPVRAYFESPAVVEEIELIGLSRTRPPVRIRDMPVSPTEVRGWTQYLRPAGFREGLAVGLFAPDDRFLGFLGLSTDTAAHPTDAARDLIGTLAPMIAHAVDPLRTITAAAWLVRGATAGVVLTRSGQALPLPGLGAHPLLGAGSALLAVAARLADGRTHAAFLCPYPGSEPAEHVRVSVLGCPTQSPHHLVAAVVLASPPDLRGLTPRELQILGLLIEGWTNARIAAELVVAPRTVAAHVEHILAKLDAGTRALAAVRALGQGLYVPPELTGIWP
jgi:DNA-binding CsgD family transcriptional regulator